VDRVPTADATFGDQSEGPSEHAGIEIMQLTAISDEPGHGDRVRPVPPPHPMEHNLLHQFNAGMKLQAGMGQHFAARQPQFMLPAEGIEKHGRINENRQPLTAR
jgi:hypothetical protein